MQRRRMVFALVLATLLMSVSLPPVTAGAPTSVSPDAPQPVEGVPIERTFTTWELVKGVDGAQNQWVPMTTVELTQQVTVKADKSGAKDRLGKRQPNATIIQVGDYVFTMERRLVNTPFGQYRYVAAGGYTMSNVVAQELRVAGNHTYGSGQCNNPALNYTGYAYSGTIVDAQQNPMQFASGLLHCVVSGFHAAMIDDSWPLWVEGQTGPEATF